MFRVVLEKPEPKLVKLSRKNVVLVTITHDKNHQEEADEKEKLIEFYMSQKNPTWSSQFKNAILLGPQIDDDNMIVDNVTLSEGVMHFVTITWKVLFACVPPVSWGGGYPAFCVALTFIGLIVVVVGDVAAMFGCLVGIPKSVTAITLVALGTSLPDLFASITAAQ